MEKTIRRERSNSPVETARIHITPIDNPASDEESEQGSPIFRCSASDNYHKRTTTITSESELFPNDRPEIRVSWTDIPDTNREQERKSFVLYVQQNSRMILAGVIDESLLNDDYLRKLVRHPSTASLLEPCFD